MKKSDIIETIFRNYFPKMLKDNDIKFEQSSYNYRLYDIIIKDSVNSNFILLTYIKGNYAINVHPFIVKNPVRFNDARNITFSKVYMKFEELTNIIREELDQRERELNMLNNKWIIEG